MSLSPFGELAIHRSVIDRLKFSPKALSLAKAGIRASFGSVVDDSVEPTVAEFAAAPSDVVSSWVYPKIWEALKVTSLVFFKASTKASINECKDAIAALRLSLAGLSKEKCRRSSRMRDSPVSSVAAEALLDSQLRLQQYVDYLEGMMLLWHELVFGVPSSSLCNEAATGGVSPHKIASFPWHVLLTPERRKWLFNLHVDVQSLLIWLGEVLEKKTESSRRFSDAFSFLSYALCIPWSCLSMMAYWMEISAELWTCCVKSVDLTLCAKRLAFCMRAMRHFSRLKSLWHECVRFALPRRRGTFFFAHEGPNGNEMERVLTAKPFPPLLTASPYAAHLLVGTSWLLLNNFCVYRFAASRCVLLFYESLHGDRERDNPATLRSPYRREGGDFPDGRASFTDAASLAGRTCSFDVRNEVSPSLFSAGVPLNPLDLPSHKEGAKSISDALGSINSSSHSSERASHWGHHVIKEDTLFGSALGEIMRQAANETVKHGENKEVPGASCFEVEGATLLLLTDHSARPQLVRKEVVMYGIAAPAHRSASICDSQSWASMATEAGKVGPCTWLHVGKASDNRNTFSSTPWVVNFVFPSNRFANETAQRTKQLSELLMLITPHLKGLKERTGSTREERLQTPGESLPSPFFSFTADTWKGFAHHFRLGDADSSPLCFIFLVPRGIGKQNCLNTQDLTQREQQMEAQVATLLNNLADEMGGKSWYEGLINRGETSSNSSLVL